MDQSFNELALSIYEQVVQLEDQLAQESFNSEDERDRPMVLMSSDSEAEDKDPRFAFGLRRETMGTFECCNHRKGGSNCA